MAKFKNIYTETVSSNGETALLCKRVWETDDDFDFNCFKSIFQLTASTWIATKANHNEYEVMLRDDPNDACVVLPHQKCLVTEYWDGDKWIEIVKIIRIEEVEE